MKNLLIAVAKNFTLRLLLPAMFAVWSGCNSEESRSSQETEIVRGLVLEVNAKSLLDIESLTIVDSVGNTWNFNARQFRGFTPSHLNEHRILGDPITVTFHRIEGDLVIEEIMD